MKYFSIIPEAQGIIHTRGVYRQVPLYERNGSIHAKHGSGFVRLSVGGATSCPSIRWSEIDTPEGEWAEKGHLVTYTAHETVGLEAAE